MTRSKTKAVAFRLANEAGAGRNVRRLLDGLGELDAGAGGDHHQVGAKARVALLISGLPIVAVIDAHDRKIGRVHDRDGGERAHIHQQLAIAGDHQHSPP